MKKKRGCSRIETLSISAETSKSFIEKPKIFYPRYLIGNDYIVITGN